MSRGSGGAGATLRRLPLGPKEPAPRRRRHFAWIQANEVAQRFGAFEDFADYARRQVSYAEQYVRDTSGRFIVLEGEDSCGGRVVNVVPYVHRFHSAYVKRLEWKLEKEVLPVLERFKHFSHVVLTIDPKRFPSQAVARSAVSRAVHSLVTRLRRRYPWVVVFKVIEWQKNGIGIHAHLLIGGKEYIPKDFIEATWSSLSSSGWAVEIRPVRGEAKYVVRYLLKYILKSVGSIDVSSAINWALNVRAFSMSMPRELRSELKAAKERAEAERLEYLEWVEEQFECSYADTDWRYVGTLLGVLDIKPGIYQGAEAERILELVYNEAM